MKLRIQQLIEAGPPSAERIDAFIEQQRPFPIVEGQNVTFVWRGEAEQVHLRNWISGLPSSQPLSRIDGTDLWHLTIALPERSRVEYKIELLRDGRREWLRDPLNPEIAHDPFGANSVAHATGYAVPVWAFEDPEARPGELQRVVLRSRKLGRQCDVRVYVPARFRRRRRYPLLVAHDGNDYVRFASLKIVLDNLIHRLEIPPLIVALTESPKRLEEYGAHPPHAEFLVEELVPHLAGLYPLIDRPADRGLLGASFGAVASLHAAWTYPGFFGRLMLQSGSFAFTDIGEHDRGPVFDPVVRWVNRLREEPGKPSERVFLHSGTYEGPIYYNRSLYPLLQSTGMEVRFVESRDGHNWENWRDRLREGLSWLFPGPLWMVYE